LGVFCHFEQFAFIKFASGSSLYSHTAPSDPSSLHQKSGIAATTQFHPGTNGWSPGGFAYPDTIAGHQKHTAIPIAPVRVGVINTRITFVGSHVQSRHPADGRHAPAPNGLTGHTEGMTHAHL